MASLKMRAASAALALFLTTPPVIGAALAVPAPQAVPVPSAPDAGPHGPASAVVDKFDVALLAVMKQADKLGYEGRAKALAPAIEQAFNIPLMTRIIVGSPWNEWGDEQRSHIIDAFGRLIISTYARRFDGYGGEEFVNNGEKPATSGGVLVTTQLTRPKDPAVTLNYLTREGDTGPQIVDVFLTGTISELATRRSEFSAVLQQGGYQGLLAALEKKVAGQAAGTEAP